VDLHLSGVLLIAKNRAGSKEWDRFAELCGGSYRCAYYAAYLAPGWRVRRFEILQLSGNQSRKIGQCAVTLSGPIRIFADQLQLLSGFQIYWEPAMNMILKALGPGRYQYGSEWCTEPPRDNELARLINIQLEDVRLAYLQAIEFERWKSWDEYWSSVSSNIRRNYQKALSENADLELNLKCELSLLRVLPTLYRLKELTLQKKQLGGSVIRSVKSAIRTTFLFKITTAMVCLKNSKVVGFSTCLFYGQHAFYLEGGATRDVPGSGWYVLASTIRYAFERSQGKGLFVMGPVEEKTMQKPEWQGLARSRQQCRVTDRPVATIRFHYHGDGINNSSSWADQR